VIYTYFRVPEPAGRSFAELDLLFERGISARKFSSTEVDVFNERVGGELVRKYEEKMEHVGPSQERPA
jgi:SP family general alpha glucoside:H+ symporter-like MFS transporter